MLLICSQTCSLNFDLCFIALQAKNVAQCVHENQTWRQNTYISLSASTWISTGDVRDLLSPFSSFGEWLGSLLPSATHEPLDNIQRLQDPNPNPFDDVQGLMLGARVYLKLREYSISLFRILFTDFMLTHVAPSILSSQRSCTLCHSD